MNDRKEGGREQGLHQTTHSLLRRSPLSPTPSSPRPPASAPSASLREGVPTVVSHGLWLNQADYDAPTLLVKPNERNTRLLDAVQTVPKVNQAGGGERHRGDCSCVDWVRFGWHTAQ